MLAHCWKYCSKFLSSAALRAKPDFPAAFDIILGCSGEVMVISRAAGCPADQQREYKSPGRECFWYQVFLLSKFFPLGGYVAKSYRPALDMQQHDHRVYPKILFYNRDTSFLFHIWRAKYVLHSCTKLIWQETEAESRYGSCRYPCS